MKLELFSFGFKYNEMPEAEMVWDVRLLPNPYWVEELRPKTGLVKEVADYVVNSSDGKKFVELLEPLLRFVVEKNHSAGKEQLRLAIGCTGGRHRSVAVVETISKLFPDLDVDLKVSHRDIERDDE